MERDRLPLPRFWYLPRGEKAVVVMSGDDHSPDGSRRHRQSLRPLPGAQPGRLLVANWECVRATLVRLSRVPRSRTRRPPRTPPRASRSRPPARRVVPERNDHRGASSAAFYDTAAGAVPDEVHERAGPRSRAARTASSGRDWATNAEGRARARDPDGRELLPLPRALDRRQARLHERRRLPDALRRSRRDARSTSTRRTRT